MPKMTPGYIRNAIGRSLHAIVDREPGKREVSELWRYFDSRCAYCDKHLDRGPGANVDHLVPASDGGAHHIFNRVLACSTCDNRKGAKPWRAHIKAVTKDAREAKRRIARIGKWTTVMSPSIAPSDRQAVDREVERVVEAFNGAVERLHQGVRPARGASRAR